jgi:hypothetical protein
MPTAQPVEFKEVITLNGVEYSAARRPLDPASTGIVYVPKTASQIQDAAGAPQLDPINAITFHHGSGASRAVGNGMAAWGENIWTCDPGIVLPGPLVSRVTLPVAGTAPVPPQGFIEYGGDLYMVAGRYVYRITGGSSAPVQDLDLGAGNVGVAFQLAAGQLHLSAGTSGPTLYSKTAPGAGNWSNSVTGTTGMQIGQMGHVYWTTSGLTAERLVTQVGSTTIRYTNGGDPRNNASYTPGTAGAAIDVGPYPIQRFVATRDHLYISTTGGLRDLDSSGLAPMLTPEIELQQSSTNGMAVLAAGGMIYINGGYDLYRVPVTAMLGYAEVEIVTPGNPSLLPNETPVHGYITALTRKGQWLIACQYDDTNNVSYISWGRDAFQGYLTSPIQPEREAGPMVWNMCPIVLRQQKVTAMWTSGLITANPRLWIAGRDIDGGIILQWAPLATQTPYQDLRNGRPYQFNPGTTTAVSLTHPAYDAGDDSMPKDFEEAAIEAENLTSGNQVQLNLATDAAPSVFTQVAIWAQGPRQVVQPEQSVVGNRLIPQLVIQGGVSSPVAIRKQSFRVNPRPDMAQVRTYLLKLGRYERHGAGGVDELNAEVRLQYLERLQIGSRITLVDEGFRELVVLLKHIGQVVEAEDSLYGGRVLAASITLRVVSSTLIPLVTLVPVRYDTTATYDSSGTYS